MASRDRIGSRTATDATPSASECTELTGDLPRGLTVHVGAESRLLNRAARRPAPTDLIVTQVQLHRRNIKHRLRMLNLPQSGFRFARPVDLARAVNRESAIETGALDRIDRLRLLSQMQTLDIDPIDQVRRVFGQASADQQTRLERARAELETVTGFHPTRLAALHSAIESLPSPLADTMQDLVAGIVGIERALRDRSDRAVTDIALLRMATRRLRDSEGTPWEAAFPTIERVTLAGISTLSASVVDFLTTLTTHTEVAVHLHLRRGTGPAIRKRLPAMATVETPGAEVFE